MENLPIDRSQIGARLYYVVNRGRVARKASVTAYAGLLASELTKWQAELTANGNDPEETTVCVVLSNGDYFSHIGPFDQYRRANLRRAGVNLPGAPSTENMHQP